MCAVFGYHKWTSKVLKGEDPNLGDGSDKAFIKSLLEYSTMYCDHCGRVSELSNPYRHVNLRDPRDPRNRIALTTEDFEALVAGKEIHKDGIAILLKEIGYVQMSKIVAKQIMTDNHN